MTTIKIHSDLHRGRVALVDDDDYAALSAYSWCVNAAGYAVARVGGQVVYLHRLLMPGAKMIDHKDGDKLNNQRSNLRPATPTQNSANRNKQPGLTSRYKGVSLHRATGKWTAQIQAHGVKRHLGTFKDELAAARAYDVAALELFGDFARTNMPVARRTISFAIGVAA